MKFKVVPVMYTTGRNTYALTLNNAESLESLLSEGWRDRATCVGCDPEIFFPSPNNTTAVRQARAICGVCPVIEQCGRFADEHQRIDGYPLQGVWGGRLRTGKRQL